MVLPSSDPVIVAGLASTTGAGGATVAGGVAGAITGAVAAAVGGGVGVGGVEQPASRRKIPTRMGSAGWRECVGVMGKTTVARFNKKRTGDRALMEGNGGALSGPSP